LNADDPIFSSPEDVGIPDELQAQDDNVDMVVTYAAAGDSLSHVITGVAWSYSDTPTAGRLTIEDGEANIVFDIDITLDGAGAVVFPEPKMGSVNTDMIVRLYAGGDAVAGKLNVLNHWTI